MQMIYSYNQGAKEESTKRKKEKKGGKAQKKHNRYV